MEKQYIIEAEHEAGGKSQYLEARVPGVCIAWGTKKADAKSYSKEEANALASGIVMAGHFAAARAVPV